MVGAEVEGEKMSCARYLLLYPSMENTVAVTCLEGFVGVLSRGAYLLVWVAGPLWRQ